MDMITVFDDTYSNLIQLFQVISCTLKPVVPLRKSINFFRYVFVSQIDYSELSFKRIAQLNRFMVPK